MTSEPVNPTNEIDTPKCPRCGSPTNLQRIEPEKPRHDRRIFHCGACGESVSETVKYR